MHRFIVILDQKTFIPEYRDAYTLIDMCNFNNWYLGTNEYQVFYAFGGREIAYGNMKDAVMDNRSKVITIDRQDIIIGSILDAEKVLNKPIKPINVPEALRNEIYTKRKISIGNFNDLERLINEYGSIFVKSNTKAKKFDTVILTKDNIDDLEDKDDEYFISTKLDIATEYRCFIHKRKLIGCKCYSDSVSIIPTNFYDFITKAIKEYKDSPASYCMDIGLTNKNEPVLIEVNNFVSCGLYGFESKSIVEMFINGWKYELSN